MNYTDDIFARLQNGESMESIANDLTKSLNDASQHYNQIKAAKEAEAKKTAAAQKIRVKKVRAVYELRDALVNVLKVWDVAPEVIAELAEYDDDEDLDSIIEVFDELLPAVEKYAAVHSAIQDMFKDEKQNVKPKKDPIEDFLNAFVR